MKCKNCSIRIEKWNEIKWGLYNFHSKSCRLEFWRIQVKVAKLKQETKQKQRRIKKIDKKHNSISYLVKQADTLFSKYIRLRDSLKTTWTLEKCKCITCWNTYDFKKIQNWHFASRRFYQTRWLDKNCNAQCYMCNVWLWWEQFKHWKAIDKMYWEWTAEQIMKLAHKMEKINPDEIKQEIENIKTKLKDYE